MLASKLKLVGFQERERDLNAERDAWTRSKSELDRMVLELKVQLKQETAMRLVKSFFHWRFLNV